MTPVAAPVQTAEPTEPLVYYVYASSATELFNHDDLLAVLKKSRANNMARGITGMLLYRDGNFLQVLEGPEAAVNETVAKISKDPRHGGMLRLTSGSLTERQFANWSMGFRDLNSNEARSTPGFDEYLNEPFDPAHFSANPTRCQRLLQHFKNNMR